MSPTYTMRRGNRYRYYISRRLMQDRGEGTGALSRVEANDVEQLVVEALGRALSRDDLAADAASSMRNMETRTMVRESVERVVVHDEEIQIVLKMRPGDRDMARADRDGHAAASTILKVSLPPARPRARKEIVVPCNAESGPRRIDQALMLALARARSWMRALRRGEYADTAQIAQRFGLSDPHVRRLLRFAYLAPDIVEAIVEGRQPRSLTVKLLLRGIPLAWSDQRAAFRFSH